MRSQSHAIALPRRSFYPAAIISSPIAGAPAPSPDSIGSPCEEQLRLPATCPSAYPMIREENARAPNLAAGACLRQEIFARRPFRPSACRRCSSLNRRLHHSVSAGLPPRIPCFLQRNPTCSDNRSRDCCAPGRNQGPCSLLLHSGG